ncbi:MAG TPA: methyltransferase, partial [Elusimicrobia bacterium]|nr:methyltransferase [Elusimicrobiota bacterium]
MKGFINVDIFKISGVDVIYDLRDLRCFLDNSADVIYASHFLEHFSTAEIPTIISEMYRVLRKNGEVGLSVPDLDKICHLYLKNIDWFTPPNSPWLGLIYGGQTNQYDFHKKG